MVRRLLELTSVVLNALPQAVLVVARDGKILFRNAASDEMLPAGEAVADVLAIEQDPAPFDWPTELAAMVVGGGQAVYRDVRVSRGGGRAIVADLLLRPLTLADVSLGVSVAEAGLAPDILEQLIQRECSLVMVEDVSERALMERRLAASERMAAIGDLAAQVAHELNNPLDGILRYIGLAERVIDGETDARRYLDGARQGLMRMAGIIRDFVEQGRFGRSGHLHEKVGKLLEEALSVMQPRVEAAGVTVVCDLAEPDRMVADGRLFQVFCNIIKNALDAMPDGGRLRIRLRREAPTLARMDFADTGGTLRAEDLDKVFQPFYTTKPPGQGSGLGLAICRDLMTRLGGTIDCEIAPEGGAVFSLTLPVSAQKKLYADEAAPSADADRPANRTGATAETDPTAE